MSISTLRSQVAERLSDHSLPAGALADIGFLLLIFFFVATTIVQEKGIQIILPPYESTPVVRPDRAILDIHINAKSEILTDDRIIPLSALAGVISSSIEKSEDKKLVISIHCDRETIYADFFAVHHEIQVVYKKMWEQHSLDRFQKSFQSLPAEQQEQIRNEIPIIVSEAEWN